VGIVIRPACGQKSRIPRWPGYESLEFSGSNSKKLQEGLSKKGSTCRNKPEHFSGYRWKMEIFPLENKNMFIKL
jgi:hypothetical protein